MSSHFTHEQVVQAKKAAIAVVGTGTSWGLQDYSTAASIAVAVAVFVYTVVQMAFLLRRWYRLEKTGWKNEKET